MKWHALLGFLIIALLSSCGIDIKPEEDCWNPKLMRVQLGDDIYDIPGSVKVSVETDNKEQLLRIPLEYLQNRAKKNHSYLEECQKKDAVPVQASGYIAAWGKSYEELTEILPRGAVVIRHIDEDYGKRLREARKGLREARVDYPYDIDFSEYEFDESYMTNEGASGREYIYFTHSKNKNAKRLLFKCQWVHTLFGERKHIRGPCNFYFIWDKDKNFRMQMRGTHNIDPSLWPETMVLMMDNIREFHIK